MRLKFKMAAPCVRLSACCKVAVGGLLRSCYSTSGMDYIVGTIKATGPLSVANYMRECLLNPAIGYYQRDNVIGNKGDFITSPEISQVFGELIGVWVVADWMSNNCRNPCHLIELGPGYGSLMKDMIRAFDQLKYILSSLSIHLVESSVKMAAKQYETLTNKAYNGSSSKLPDPVLLHNNIKVSWYSSIKEIPQGYSYVIANELFDALPVQQFKLTDKGWKEVLVDIDKENGGLMFVLGATPSSLTYTSLLANGCSEGEVSVDGLLLAEDITNRLVQHGGASLIVDYGEEIIDKFTLRGFSTHKEANILTNPGEIDLTADVNFGMIMRHVTSRGGVCHGPVTQNVFLHKMGIRQRIDVLLKTCSANKAESLIKGYEMLTSPAKMGQRFKFLCITNSAQHIPTPF